jgi:hypothetical protein
MVPTELPFVSQFTVCWCVRLIAGNFQASVGPDQHLRSESRSIPLSLAGKSRSTAAIHSRKLGDRSRPRLQPDDRLPDVAAFVEQAHGTGRAFEPVEHILVVADRAAAHEGCQTLEDTLKFVGMVL